jgi:GT2 family glycosyltransferase
MPGSSAHIIVLAWNGRDDTLECLRSLEAVRAEDTRVVVVDNGSTDATAEAVASAFPWVELLRSDANLGYAGGNNLGLRRALAEGSDHAILLNNDTVVDPRFAAELVQAAQERPEAGFLTSKIYFHDRPGTLWFAGATLDTWTGRARHPGYGERDTGRYDVPHPTDLPCGCSMLVTRRLLETVGLMEESLFLYGEEVDWALRARAAGFSTLFVPSSKVWHKVSRGTGGTQTGRYLYYAVRNMLRTLNALAPVSPLLRAVRNATVVATFAASVFTTETRVVPGLANVWAGARDYGRGISGPRPSAGAAKGRRP